MSARLGGALAALLALSFAARLGVALWAADRGFELGDEGLFLLLLNGMAEPPPAFELYRLLARTGGLAVGVVGARIARIAVELAGTLALVAGVWAWASARVLAPGAVRFSSFLLFSLLGSLLGVGSRSLSYNDFTNLFSYGAVGALFALASGRGARGGRVALAAVAGLCTGLQLLAKFPPAIVLAGGSAAALALGPFGRERGRLLAAWGAGALAALGLLLLANGGPAGLLDTIRLAAAIRPLVGYEPLEMLARYAAIEVWTFRHAAVFGFVLAGGAWLLGGLARPGSDRGLAVAMAFATALLVALVSAVHPTFLHASLVVLAAFLVGVCPLLWLLAAHARGGARALAPLLVLMGVPVVAILGTNVPPTLRLPTHVQPLIVALAVLALDLRARAGLRALHGVLAAALLAIGSAVFFQHQIVKPYGLPAPIADQLHPVSGLPGVRVDVATRAFLEDAAESMERAGFRPGDPVVALDYMPGLVFYLKGRSPGSAFYMFDKPAFNCFGIARAGFTSPPYLILGQPMPVAQRDCIEAFAFPGDFRTVRSLRNPYEDVYAGFGAPGFSHVQLFAPRSGDVDQRR